MLMLYYYSMVDFTLDQPNVQIIGKFVCSARNVQYKLTELNHLFLICYAMDNLLHLSNGRSHITVQKLRVKTSTHINQ